MFFAAVLNMFWPTVECLGVRELYVVEGLSREVALRNLIPPRAEQNWEASCERHRRKVWRKQGGSSRESIHHGQERASCLE